jgi:hypothetical protein
MIGPSSIILEVGRSISGQGSGDLDYSLRVAKLCQLNDADLQDFKSLLVEIINRAIEEQAVRRMKKADPITGEIK